MKIRHDQGYAEMYLMVVIQHEIFLIKCGTSP
jgi:hypothetical protein